MHLLEMNRLAAVGKGTATSSTYGPSKTIWNSCPWLELATGTKSGFAFFDDFLGSSVQAANVANSATTLNSPWSAFTDATAGSTIASGVSPSDAVGTMILLATTANEGVNVGLMTNKAASGTGAP